MSVQTASNLGTRYHAMPEDDVGLHLEFGRRYVFFTLEAATTLTCQQLPAKSANDVLMWKVSEQRLPLPLTSGSGGTATGMDQLVSDVIDLLKTARL